MIETHWLLPSLLAAGGAATLSAVSLGRLPRARWVLFALLVSTALLHGTHALAMVSGETGLGRLKLAFTAWIVQSALLVLFTRSLLARLEGGKVPARLLWQTLAFSLLLVVAIWAPEGLVERDYYGVRLTTVGLWGQLACGGMLVLALFGIAGLEQLLRRTRDPIRYQLKFLLLGLGVLSVICVYTTSTFLLEATWWPQLVVAHSSVTLLGLGLVGVGLHRLRRSAAWSGRVVLVESSDSLSLAIAGTFLLAMGAAGALLPHRITTSGYVLEVTTAAATVVALAVMLASRYVRTSLHRFAARTFKRSKYDYRRKWLEVIAAFHGVNSVDAILDRLVDLMGRSFSTGRISVWVQSDADGKFYQARSVNVESPPRPLPPSHPVVVAASATAEVIRGGVQVVVDDEFARLTHMKLIGPLWGGTLLGFVVLGEETGGSDYDQDDEDLLQAVSHHAGVLLAHARLAARHRAASEARALHELSVFCMHDLKNLAGRLSLVAQNAKRFGDNPQFQRSALRTVSTTVERMVTLIQKLSAGAEFPPCSEARESTDLFEVLDSATETLKEGVRLTLPPVPTPRPKVAIAKEALRNVVLNVVTNAEQALGTEGEITILVEQADERCRITVRDDGPGIEPEVLAKVFEPFNSTKKHGLGIGLYQCRRTLQGVGGSIVVDSQPGVGTEVKLELPLTSEEVA